MLDRPETGVTRRETVGDGLRSAAPSRTASASSSLTLWADTTPIEELTVPAVVEHLESVVSPIEPAPILMGHSAGGVFTQLLMIWTAARA